MIQKYIISLPPITKKNSQQILTNHRTGKPFIAPSSAYKRYEEQAIYFLTPKPKTPLAGRDAYRRIADLPVCTVLQKDFRALEGAKMNILLSILGTAIVTSLIAGAYSIGVSVGRAAAGYEDDDREPVIYMDHTHGGE